MHIWAHLQVGCLLKTQGAQGHIWFLEPLHIMFECVCMLHGAWCMDTSCPGKGAPHQRSVWGSLAVLRKVCGVGYLGDPRRLLWLHYFAALPGDVACENLLVGPLSTRPSCIQHRTKHMRSADQVGSRDLSKYQRFVVAYFILINISWFRVFSSSLWHVAP